VPLKIKLSIRLILTAVFLAVVVMFAWNFDKSEPTLVAQNGVPRFVLSTRLLMWTYVLPNIITWAMGLYACLCIANYSIFTKGAIYKSLFGSLYKGILLVYICIFIAQLFIMSNFNLNHFSIGLVLIYALLLLAVLGFVLIYKGAKSLSKLEKV